MSQGIFITGTDTGVGKTVVTAAIALSLQAQGLRVGVMKPVESGCPMQDGSLITEDATFLWNTIGHSIPFELVNQYALTQPLAPALAAELDGVTIDLDVIHQCYVQLAARSDVVLVEGAGGLLVPLMDSLTMHDMAVSLDLPILIVSRNVLGTINHTALTVTVAQQRSNVLGIILNTTSAVPDEATQTNLASLHRWGGAEILGQIPYLSALDVNSLKTVGNTIQLPDFLKRTITNANERSI